MPKADSEPKIPSEIVRRDEDQALRAILEGTARSTGKEFFRALVSQLAQVLEVRYGLVTELLPEGDKLRTLAFWDQDRFVENLTYPIQGTPCEGVVYGGPGQVRPSTCADSTVG